MEPLTITIPDPAVKAFVDDMVSSGNFTSPGDYVLALIREDRKRRGQARLEALLLEGLQGEPTPLIEADWDDMRWQYDARHIRR